MKNLSPLDQTAGLTAERRLTRPSEVALTLSADTNDAAPTGYATATRFVIYDATGGHKLTGLAAGALGDEITIEYRLDAVGVVTLTARDPLSSSGNRFVMAHDVALKPYQSISFRYGSDAGGNGWFTIDDRFGTVASHDASEFALAFTDTGILITGGAIGGVALVPSVTASEARGMLLGEYDYDSGNWQLWIYPPPSSGTFTLDVRKQAFASGSASVPDAGDSIVASAPPTITAGSSFVTASGSQGTWIGSPLTRGDMLTVAVTANTALVQQYVLFIPARRTL